MVDMNGVDLGKIIAPGQSMRAFGWQGKIQAYRDLTVLVADILEGNPSTGKVGEYALAEPSDFNTHDARKVIGDRWFKALQTLSDLPADVAVARLADAKKFVADGDWITESAAPKIAPAPSAQFQAQCAMNESLQILIQALCTQHQGLAQKFIEAGVGSGLRY